MGKELKKTILIVEDDEFLLRSFKRKLEQDGFHCILARDGEAALERMKEEYPDLILLDLVMPKLNGFEFLKIVRSTKEGKNVPVIVLSNLGQNADIDEVKSLGVARYLIKAQHSLQEVIQYIEKALKRE